MNRTLPVFSVLVFVALGAWVWALRQGPGKLELPVLAPWPKALAAVPARDLGVTLNGTLRHANGTPAADALVQTTVPDGTRWGWTNGSGAFTLTRLPSDPGVRAGLSFVALALEHMPATFTLTSTKNERVNWTLPPPTADLEAMPELTFADFTGQLVRASGAPEGLEVWLVPPPGADPLSGQIERRATVDADGSYSFPSLTTGIYQARVLPAWARGGTWPILGTGALPFDPKSSQPLPRLATLEGRITGRVTGVAKQPLSGALVLVNATDETNHVWPPAVSDATGFFEVPDLPPGLYHLELATGDTHKELELRVPAGGEATARFDLAND